MKRALTVAAAGLAAVGLALGALVVRHVERRLERPDPGELPTTNRAAERPVDRPARRVVLVTLDTLRADRLGSYGYPRDTSPFFDRLAASGTRFENAIAVMSTTAPAHASMLTGLHPIEHGVTRNGHVLDDAFETVPERFEAAGFETAGFVSVPDMFSTSNLRQGFDTFDEHELRWRDWLDLDTWSVSGRYRLSESTVAAALDWFERLDAGATAFAWIHLWDPHRPYAKLQPEPAAWDDDHERMRAHWRDAQGIEPAFFDDFRWGLAKAMALYDREVLAIDRAIERLVRGLERAGRLDDTVLVFVADHGNGLGSHDWFAHGKHLYEEQVRVPLVVWSADGRFAAQVVTEVVGQPDLAPTLLELGGLPTALPRSDAQSLVGLLRGDASGFVERPALSQRMTFHDLTDDVREDDRYEPGDTYAIRTATHRYLLRTAGEDELYDLVADPTERENLLGQGLAVEVELRDTLVARIAELERGRAPSVATTDESAVETLRALGYLQ